MRLLHRHDQGVPELPRSEVEIKEGLWDYRFHPHRLLKQATKELSEKLGTLAIASTEEGDVYQSGAYSVLYIP